MSRNYIKREADGSQYYVQGICCTPARADTLEDLVRQIKENDMTNIYTGLPVTLKQQRTYYQKELNQKEHKEFWRLMGDYSLK